MAKRRKKWTVRASKVLYEADRNKLLLYVESNQQTAGRVTRARIVRLLMQTGLRVSELIGLRVCDTPAVIGANVIEVRGKGDKVRNVPVSEKMAERIAGYIAGTRRKVIPQHVRNDDITQPVFFNAGRRRLTRHGVYRMVKRAGESAGIIKPISPHKLRHTFCTVAMTRVARPAIVQAIMGHSSLRTTELYTDVSGVELRGLGETFEQALAGECSHNTMQMEQAGEKEG